MEYFKRNILLFVVFLTGACVLVIEVVALRILSPYFGNTLYTASSVIGIILGALSVGYYIGGKLSDIAPKESFFFGIIFASGINVLLIQFLRVKLLTILGYKLSIITGPVVAALLLFFLPSILLGMLSPFAVKLVFQHAPAEGLGSITGKVFFWSTLGSIFGSFLAGFFLIPNFGISNIIIGVGFTLIAISGCAYLGTKSKKKLFTPLILIIISTLLLLLIAPQESAGNVVLSFDGIYEKIKIIDDTYGGRPVRFFYQDRSSSGAMYLDGQDHVYDYTKYYAIYKAFIKEPKEILVIGGGAYTIPKAYLKDLPQVNVDVSEIEPSLYEIGKKYFFVPENPRLKNYVADGRRFLHDSQKKYDIIFSDVYYSLYSIPSHFTTKEFFLLAKEKLRDGGIFIANVIGSLSRQEPSFTLSEIKTFQNVFPNSYFFAVQSPQYRNSQNLIFVGYNSDARIDFGNVEISNVENDIIQNLESKYIDIERFNFAQYPIFSDNFSPVEYFTSQTLKRRFIENVENLNGEEMMALIKQQLSFGPRFLSSSGHKDMQEFLFAEVKALANTIVVQQWEHRSLDGNTYQLANIVGRFFPEFENRIILGTHYDSKKYAVKDKTNPNKFMPGANDSASGVATLLELASYLANTHIKPAVGVDLVFFDGEEGEEWIKDEISEWRPLGSYYFASHLDELYKEKKAKSGIIVDMVCDKDLKILKEKYSLENAEEQMENFWEIASKISPDVFLQNTRPAIYDDHLALNYAGIPTFLLIDFDYPYFHTTQDTMDKCSERSLEIVAKSVVEYIYKMK